ncbi:MAG: DUF86 domain-containing protein [Okeania sp. SIO2D1]|nr:DUF86 domain-containing protein [Okeania sp. SIO2D1]
MSKIDDQTRLNHMLDAAREASTFIQGETRESLNENRMLELSLVRLIEIIGEAASRISQKKQAAIPRIPWKQVISMRNRLIHAYFDVDLDILWQTVTEDLEPLIKELAKVVEEES